MFPTQHEGRSMPQPAPPISTVIARLLEVLEDNNGDYDKAIAQIEKIGALVEHLGSTDAIVSTLKTIQQMKVTTSE